MHFHFNNLNVTLLVLILSLPIIHLLRLDVACWIYNRQRSKLLATKEKHHYIIPLVLVVVKSNKYKQ